MLHILENAVVEIGKKYPSFVESVVRSLQESFLRNLLMREFSVVTVEKQEGLDTHAEIKAAVGDVVTKEKDEETVEVLEEIEDEFVNVDEDTIGGSVKYGFDEEAFLREQFYGSAVVSYDVEKMWYSGDGKRGAEFKSEEFYQSSGMEKKISSGILSTVEAEKVFKDIQYSSVFGRPGEVSTEDREKFNMWIQFNKVMFYFFESTAISREVNYAPQF